jgi:hypothetical protein
MRGGAQLCMPLELVPLHGGGGAEGHPASAETEGGVIGFMINGPSEEQVCAVARMILERQR